MASPIQDPEYKTVIQEIRSILQSAPSNGLTAKDLSRDYKDMVGNWVPFKRFGYNSIDDMLSASGEFIFKQTFDGIKIIQKETRQSAHINRLVQETKFSGRKKKKSNKAPIARRPIHTMNADSRHSQLAGSAYSAVYSRLPNRSYKKAVAASQERQTQRVPSQIPPLMSLDIESPAEINANSNQKRQQQPTLLAQRNINILDMRPITKQSNVPTSQFTYSKDRVDPPQANAPAARASAGPVNGDRAPGGVKSRLGNRITTNGDVSAFEPYKSNSDLSASQSSIKSSVNDRLSKYPKISAPLMNGNAVDVVDFARTVAPTSNALSNHVTPPVVVSTLFRFPR